MKLILPLILAVFISRPASADPQKDLTVAVAANMQFAIEELKSVFEKETDITIEIILGSSGKLTAQIKNGAPYDVFLAADMHYPEYLFNEKLTFSKPEAFCEGGLILWTLQETSPEKNLLTLLEDNAGLIAISHPQSSPYGKAAQEALLKLGYYEKIKSQLVYGENLAQVNQYIVSKVVSAGFTSKSSVVSGPMKDRGQWIEIPEKDHSPLKQGGVILAYGHKHHPETCKRFFKFLFSKKAKDILEKYGYETAPGDAS